MESDSEGIPKLRGLPSNDSEVEIRTKDAAVGSTQDRLKLLGESNSSGTWKAAVRGLVRSNQELEAIAVAIEAPFNEVKTEAVSLLEKRLRDAAKEVSEGRRGYEPASLRMLDRLLSDPAPAIRAEAMRVCLNLNAGGSEENTLRLLLASRFPDIRGHVLKAISDHGDKSWTLDLLMEMLDDSDTALRSDAYSQATKRGRGRGVQHLTWVMSGPHRGLKRLALEELGGRRGFAVEQMLSNALRESDTEIACRAVEVIARSEANHLLLEALDSPREEVMLAAAQALARAGDPDGLPALLAYLEKEDAITDAGIESTLNAIAALGDEEGGEVAARYALHASAGVRAAAIRALAVVANESNEAMVKLFRGALDDQSERVRVEAAVALVMRGDAACKPMLAVLPSGSQEEAWTALRTAVAVADTAPEYLVALADNEDHEVRVRAQFFAVLSDAGANSLRPEFCLRLLSCKHKDSRLAAIRALTPLTSEQRTEDYVHQLLAEAGKLRPLAADTSQQLTALLALARPRVRLRAAELVLALFEDGTAFEAKWKRFAERHAFDLREALVLSKQRQAETHRRAINDFIALVPNTPNSLPSLRRRKGPGGRAEPARLARAWEALRDVAGPLILLACCDPDLQVRTAAHHTLSELGMDPAYFGLADHAALSRALQNLGDKPEVAAVLAEESLVGKIAPIDTPAPPAERVPAVSGPPPIKYQAPKDPPAAFNPADNLLTPQPQALLATRDKRVTRLAGEIATRGAVCDIFAFLGQSGWRGELQVVDGQFRRQLYFDHGNVVGAGTNVVSERLGDVMFRFGAIDVDEQAQIESLLGTGRRFGQVAIHLGLINQDQLFTLIGNQISTIAFGSFAVSSGRFYFFDGFEEGDLATRHALSAMQLLMEGMSQQDEFELYRTKIPSDECVPVRIPQEKPPPKPLLAVYELVDGTRTVTEIGRGSQLGTFGATKKLYELMQSRHISVNLPSTALPDAIKATNDSIQQIKEAIAVATKPDAFCAGLIHSQAAHQLVELGFTVEDNAMVSAPTYENPPPVAESTKALQDYVGTALLLVESHAGSAAEKELRAKLTGVLDKLRPRGKVVADAPPSSNSFQLAILESSIAPKPI